MGFSLSGILQQNTNLFFVYVIFIVGEKDESNRKKKEKRKSSSGEREERNGGLEKPAKSGSIQKVQSGNLEMISFEACHLK